MSRVLFLLVGVIVLSKSNGTLMSSKSSLTPDDSDEEFSILDWSDVDVVYPGDPYTESIPVAEKRANREALMRRSTLDKNFMRFGRSGYFPGERCCRQKDLVGLAESYSGVNDPISLTKRETDSNFMRFGRSGKDNFMRFGKSGGDNFMRFGRPDKDKGNFMRFGKGGGGDNFMRFGKGGGGENFMRFGRPDKDKDKGNFMRFGRDDKGNFMWFGRGGDHNFIRSERGEKDNFIRFGREDSEEGDFSRSGRNENFMRFDKNPMNFIRNGKSGGKDDSFIRFGKSGRNGTNFLRFGRDSGEDMDSDEEAKNNLRVRRKRMTPAEGESPYDRKTRNPEVMEDVLPEMKRSTMEESVTKPNLLKFISFINMNHPNWEGKMGKSLFQWNPSLKPIPQTYKRKQDGSAFIRFG